jgi:hypothetical protein
MLGLIGEIVSWGDGGVLERICKSEVIYKIGKRIGEVKGEVGLEEG